MRADVYNKAAAQHQHCIRVDDASELLGVDAQPYAQVHGLGDTRHRDAEHQVVADLGNLSCSIIETTTRMNTAQIWQLQQSQEQRDGQRHGRTWQM
jgi:hypothetical protein